MSIGTPSQISNNQGMSIAPIGSSRRSGPAATYKKGTKIGSSGGVVTEFDRPGSRRSGRGGSSSKNVTDVGGLTVKQAAAKQKSESKVAADLVAIQQAQRNNTAIEAAALEQRKQEYFKRIDAIREQRGYTPTGLVKTKETPKTLPIKYNKKRVTDIKVIDWATQLKQVRDKEEIFIPGIIGFASRSQIYGTSPSQGTLITRPVTLEESYDMGLLSQPSKIDRTGLPSKPVISGTLIEAPTEKGKYFGSTKELGYVKGSLDYIGDITERKLLDYQLKHSPYGARELSLAGGTAAKIAPYFIPGVGGALLVAGGVEDYVDVALKGEESRVITRAKKWEKDYSINPTVAKIGSFALPATEIALGSFDLSRYIKSSSTLKSLKGQEGTSRGYLVDYGNTKKFISSSSRTAKGKTAETSITFDVTKSGDDILFGAGKGKTILRKTKTGKVIDTKTFDIGGVSKGAGQPLGIKEFRLKTDKGYKIGPDFLVSKKLSYKTGKGEVFIDFNDINKIFKQKYVSLSRDVGKGTQTLTYDLTKTYVRPLGTKTKLKDYQRANAIVEVEDYSKIKTRFKPKSGIYTEEISKSQFQLMTGKGGADLGLLTGNIKKYKPIKVKGAYKTPLETTTVKPTKIKYDLADDIWSSSPVSGKGGNKKVIKQIQKSSTLSQKSSTLSRKQAASASSIAESKSVLMFKPSFGKASSVFVGTMFGVKSADMFKPVTAKIDIQDSIISSIQDISQISDTTQKSESLSTQASAGKSAIELIFKSPSLISKKAQSPVSPIIPLPIKFSLPSTVLIHKDEKKQQGYMPQTLEKGKYNNLSKNPMSRSAALGRMSKTMDNTTSARGRIVKRKGKVSPVKDDYFSRTSHKYRPYKIKKGITMKLHNTFIEKRSNRIDTIGEKRGLSASKYAKSQGWIIPGKKKNTNNKSLKRKSNIKKPDWTL